MGITVTRLACHLIESYFLTIYTAGLSSNKTLSVDVFYCNMINIYVKPRQQQLLRLGLIKTYSIRLYWLLLKTMFIHYLNGQKYSKI